jgi:hypothetical protein
MSPEMVACIAIESISILEKMHSKGSVNTTDYSFLVAPYSLQLAKLKKNGISGMFMAMSNQRISC